MKKILSMLIIIMLLMNSSVLMLTSLAVDEENNVSMAEMELSKNQLTNKTQNEIIINGILKRNSQNDILYENPTISFEFPNEIEKIVINDIKILYDNELTIKEYKIEENENGNKVLKIFLDGKQTQLQADGIVKGTNIRVSANIIVKTDIKAGEKQIKMTCVDGNDQSKSATCEGNIKLINAYEINTTTMVKDEINGITINQNGLEINIKPIIGNSELQNNSVIYTNEIIKYDITVKNTTENEIKDIEILGHIPDGLVYAEYNEKAFSYWSETYTVLEGKVADENGVYWQDDTYQYNIDEELKEKRINIEKLQSGESQNYSYEVKVKSETEQDIDSQIDINIGTTNVYTYHLLNKIKLGEIEVRSRQYISRTNKNEFIYHFIVKNLTNDSKNGILTFNIPENIEIEEVKAINTLSTEDAEYEEKDKKLTIQCNNIEANYFVAYSITVKVNMEETEDNMYNIGIGANFTSTDGDNSVYWSNESVCSGGIEAIKITQTSETNGEKIKEFKDVTYTFEIENKGYVIEELGGYSSIVFEDYIPNELNIKSVEYNNYNVEKTGVGPLTKYKITNEDKKMESILIAQANGLKTSSDKARIKLNLNIKNGGKITIKITASVRKFDNNQNNLGISNYAIVSGNDMKAKQSNFIQNTIYHPETTGVIVIDKDGNIVDSNKPTPDVPDNTQTTKTKYTISGMAWIDENLNGQRDESESAKSGIEVLLYNISAKKFITDEKGNVVIKTTGEDGKYTFTNIYSGQYYVIFKYDTENYGITEYQASNVSTSQNNDAIEKLARIFDETRTIGITNTINLNSNRSDIDIGLVENKNFDLKIEQFIEKITVTNKKGTKEYNYNDKKIAKFEIHSKQFVGSTVVVEYKVKVTNVGDLAGNVYEILSEIPSKMEFHSELNSGWTKSLANSISNVSFANTTIKPGESIETTIVLSKTLDDKDAGTYTNIAKISTSESQRHTEDSNVNNDTDQTEVIIDVATGAKIAFRVIGGVIMGLLYIALMIYFIRRVVSKKGMFVIFGIIFMTSIFAFSPKEFAYDVSSTVSGLEAELNSSISDAIAETKIGTDTKINVVLVRDQNGANFFYKVNADGSKTPLAGGCGDPGSHFSMGHGCYTKVDGDPIYDEEGNITGYEPEDVEIECSANYDLVEVPMGLVSTSEAVVTVGTVTVSGDDIPPEGLELSWDEFGQNFSVEGNMPGSFSAKESSALWDGLASVVDRNNPASTSSKDIESALGAAGYKGSYTADQVKGTDGVTGLSVTLTRTVNVCVSASATWTNTYQVEAQYHCPKCGASSTKFQHVTDQQSTAANACTSISFSTTISFWPEELPKTLILYKIDADTKEELYTVENNQCKSEFKFLVKQKGTNSQWEVGVGEQITGLYAGTYEIYEIDTQYGYGIWDDNYDTSKGLKKIAEINLPDDGQVIHNVIIENKKQFIDLSGYVWEDMLNGKDNARNNLFQNDQYDDKDKLVPGVKVILHDTVRNRELVTWTNENGEYHFGSRNEDLTYTDDTLRIADLDKYYIEFEYNGVKYRNVKLNPDVNVTNASRASEEVASGKSDEDSSVRQRFNERFSTISSGTQIDSNGESTGIVIDANGNVNSDKISYTKNGEHQSQINYGKNMTEANGNKEAYGENIYHIKATTYKNLNLSDYLEGYIKKENTTIVHVNEIKNINLGLYSREQVDVAVDSDVARFVLNVNGYQHTYKYATLVNPDTQEEMDVKLKALKGKYYERQLHESTISYSATPEGVPNLYADITYKIYLQNKSNTLTAKIKELTLNYDEDLKIISYGYEGSNVNTEVSESAITATKNGTGAVQLKEATIDLEKLEDRKISAGKREVLEVTFRTDANTIAKILNNPTGIKFDFMAEVKTYSTYANNEENAFNRAEGIYAYASIDKNSAARNAQVQIDTDDSFVTDTFENDTTIAPTFKLSKGTQTELSGIVYEDSPKESTPIKISGNNIYERVGDGIYNNENVMANVLVELLSVPMENGQYDSDTARTGENGQQEYDVAKLYQENKTTQGESSKVLARTYTNEKGEYKFEGLTAGNYVIKYTYGKNMKDVDENGQEKGTIRSATAIYTSDGKTKLKEIEAREYKSTVITSGEISNAMNITDGKAHLNGDYSWFLKSPETRYSDAVDDVEYRANLEKEAKINYEILKGTKTYVYENMEAYTPYFKLGVEEFNDQQSGATLETQEDGTLNHVFTIDNVDFGLIERPIVDLQVDKVITGLKVSLGNGQVLINGDPSKESLPYVRTGLDDFVPIEMDTELLQNATIEEEYTIKITNNSELDYSIYPIWGTDNTQKVALRRNYYYYGTQEGLTTDEAVTTRIDVLGDYIGSELTADESTMPEWNKRAVEELTSYNGTNLFTTENDGKKEKTLREGKYTIYTTNTFNNPNEEIVTIGQTKSIAYKVSRLLAVNTDTMKYTNDVEILQYSGYSQNKDRTEENTYNRVKDTTPGNLVPGGAMEDDEDSVRTTITPPTGTIISRWLYVTTVAAGLILVGATIIFIRKRVLVK